MSYAKVQKVLTFTFADFLSESYSYDAGEMEICIGKSVTISHRGRARHWMYSTIETLLRPKKT